MRQYIVNFFSLVVFRLTLIAQAPCGFRLMVPRWSVSSSKLAMSCGQIWKLQLKLFLIRLEQMLKMIFQNSRSLSQATVLSWDFSCFGTRCFESSCLFPGWWGSTLQSDHQRAGTTGKHGEGMENAEKLPAAGLVRDHLGSTFYATTHRDHWHAGQWRITSFSSSFSRVQPEIRQRDWSSCSSWSWWISIFFPNFSSFKLASWGGARGFEFCHLWIGFSLGQRRHDVRLGWCHSRNSLGLAGGWGNLPRQWRMVSGCWWGMARGGSRGASCPAGRSARADTGQFG